METDTPEGLPSSPPLCSHSPNAYLLGALSLSISLLPTFLLVKPSLVHMKVKMAGIVALNHSFQSSLWRTGLHCEGEWTPLINLDTDTGGS